MITPFQESSLVSAGDCFEHWHSADRVLDHVSVLSLQGASPAFSVSENFTVTLQQDFILVDTTLKSITISLPLASNGREIEIMKNARPNTLIIQSSGLDLILDSSEVRVYNYGTSLRFKATSFGWIMI